MYLSKIEINNYKGVKNLTVNFDSSINIIIGENGSCKSALIDAIRLLYNLGEPIKQISVSKDDFFEHPVYEENRLTSIQKADLIRISYEFRGLSEQQKGAFFEYMVPDITGGGNDYARIELQYKDDPKYPIFTYSAGAAEGQKPDHNTFRLFQHYYLSALRDSTKDLLNVRNNLLGKVIRRLVVRSGSEAHFKQIMSEANSQLLARPEVTRVRTNVNENLKNIFKNTDENQIGVLIEQSKLEYIVNSIKPYLPHDYQNNSEDGFTLWQNSLGFNNLIYIATVLGDIKESNDEDPIPHHVLLIEEPEAHLHPQLQLSLYNFLKEANTTAKSQLFITTHSPTLTSKVPLENLILLDGKAFNLSEIFVGRSSESLIQDTVKGTILRDEQIKSKKKQLERYIDVTKSQLFFAKSCLFVEGISEEMLISVFCKVLNFSLEDYRIELVNVDGISFYPFMFLFNSSNTAKKLSKKIAILTDDDRFTDSKKDAYKLNKLAEDNFAGLADFHRSIVQGEPANRINNLNSIRNSCNEILVCPSFQTFELAICIANVPSSKSDLSDSFLFKFIKDNYAGADEKIQDYLNSITNDALDNDTRQKIAILLWKTIPSKAEFSQDLAQHIAENLELAKAKFKIPVYIMRAFVHLTR